jgi:hypothetical protein
MGLCFFGTIKWFSPIIQFCFVVNMFQFGFFFVLYSLSNLQIPFSSVVLLLSHSYGNLHICAVLVLDFNLMDLLSFELPL